MLLLTTNARQIDPYPSAPSILLRLWLLLFCYRVLVFVLGGDMPSSLLLMDCLQDRTKQPSSQPSVALHRRGSGSHSVAKSGA